MKKILTLTVLLFLSLNAFSADEEVRYYDVELILFENLELGSRQSELWPSSVERTDPEPETVIKLNSPSRVCRRINTGSLKQSKNWKNLQVGEYCCILPGGSRVWIGTVPSVSI